MTSLRWRKGVARPTSRLAWASAWASALLLTSSCDREPAFVYVLGAPQTVSLSVSASATKVTAGEPIVLHAARRTTGTWKRIAMKDRRPDQCWMSQPPPESEDEVADNLRWEATPATAAQFNTDLRADHTRSVTFVSPGTVTLASSSSVWCEPGRSVNGSLLQIEVGERR